MKRYFFSSVTRITPFTQESIALKKQPFSEWKTGDYVAGMVSAPPGNMQIELPSGRMAEVAEGDIIIGALGNRHATLGATGTWLKIGSEGIMNLLSAGGIFGKMTSISSFEPALIETHYLGHVHLNGEGANMKDYVPEIPKLNFAIPVVLIVGTSMSAGKTTTAKIIIRQLKQAGLKVAAAKLTGTGRYRDILGMYDAGADSITDFVDAGLPTTVVPPDEYIPALEVILSKVQATNSDIAVIEIGASPLETYNGDHAIHYIQENVKFRVLCASDPYAVYGVMKAFGSQPDLVTGIATNTIAGVHLINNLVDVPSLNLIYPKYLPELRRMLKEKLEGIVDINFEVE
jgi:hypothetical protein